MHDAILKNLGYNDFENHVCFLFSRFPSERSRALSRIAARAKNLGYNDFSTSPNAFALRNQLAS
jgi:hypothetical protein